MRIALIISWIAWFVAVPASAVRPAESTGHLYVGGIEEGKGGEILRFPLVDGVPATSPDLTYPGFTNPLTVGVDGSLVATTYPACCDGLKQVNVFAPNATEPSRWVFMPQLHMDGTDDTALALSPEGALFAGYQYFISGAATVFAGENDMHRPIIGIAVYGRSADGHGPRATFSIHDDISGPTGLALGPDGNLYASVQTGGGLPDVIDTIASPLHAPHVIRTLFMQKNAFPAALAFSGPDRALFVLSYRGGRPSPQVDVYPNDASGHAKPTRTLILVRASGAGLAVGRTYIYATSPHRGDFVYGYRKDASGYTLPTFSLRLEPQFSASALALGP